MTDEALRAENQRLSKENATLKDAIAQCLVREADMRQHMQFQCAYCAKEWVDHCSDGCPTKPHCCGWFRSAKRD